jgi:uncharacterized coiled-coil DUF342 family protein
MDDQSDLVQDYELTIESMRREISLLKEKLDCPIEISRISQEYEKFENDLERYRQDIEGNTADLIEEKKKQASLIAEEEWIKTNSQEFQESKVLNQRINDLNTQIFELKREKLETSSNVNIEQLKDTNPNLYNHVKRALKAEWTHYNLKQEQSRLKKEKKNLNIGYYKVTQAFATEEKLKLKIKEFEGILEEKGKYIDQITNELSELQEKIQITKKNIQNVEVRKLLFEYNELKSDKERLSNNVAEISAEIQSVQEKLEKTSKNPEKITPTAANQNLRKEIQQLETKIIEASKQIKEKEKEHLQAQFNYEEAKKVLKELQQPEIQFVRSNTNRRVTISDSPITEKRLSVLISNDVSSQASPSKKSCLKQEESVASPEKRNSILNIVGKGMTETLTEQLAKVLKGVGKPNHSIASKLLAVNRGELIGKMNSK